MRIALLSYRSKPHVGGQGVYIRHLSRELAKLGHTVEIFSGQPYPDLDLVGEGVTLTKVPSLGLYEEPNPFGNPKLSELRDLVDVEEWARMRTGAFPEPLTFAKRVLKVLKERKDDPSTGSGHRFDIVHDNQTLATPLLSIEPELGLPLVTTIHHPISFDRRIELESAKGWKKKFGVWRWYSFVKMQAKVASQLRHVITPSDNSKRDILTDFGVPSERVQTVHLGVPEEFVPPTQPRVPGRILAMASADAPLKGIAFLLEAFAKLRTERDLELVLVSKPKKGGPTEQLIEKLAIKDHVRFVNGISDAELVELMGSAEIACVPSLYEGFSLPTAELMACGTPLVVSRAGAIPEVVGPDDLCAKQVTPGETEELEQAIAALLDDPERQARYSAAGRARVEEHFSWHAVAERMTALYQQSIDEFGLAKLDHHRTRSQNGRK